MAYVGWDENMEQALSFAQQAVDIDPHNSWLYVNLGRVLLAMGREADALVAGRRSLALAREEGEERYARDFLYELELYGLH